ncbi:MAG: hypothetical protein ACRDGE_03520 [Candidatus Limnocylindria bacterium]
MRSLALAAILGIGLFPVLLVFPPLYFLWALLVVACANAAAGLTIRRARLERALALAVLAGTVTVAIALATLGARAVRPDAIPALFVTQSPLLLPAVGGAVIGALARRRLGGLHASAAVVAGAAVLTRIGFAIAGLFAPGEVANAPGFRNQCWMTAERRRILAVERVVAWDGRHMTCTYTAWGGIHVGTVRDSGWSDGWWPELFRPRVAD